MLIDLNNPKEFTLDNVRTLIAAGNDSVHTQIRVSKDGYLYLSEVVGNKELDNVLFRLETNAAYNGLVGEEAAKDSHWVSRIFDAVGQNWPNPTKPYIDVF